MLITLAALGVLILAGIGLLTLVGLFAAWAMRDAIYYGD